MEYFMMPTEKALQQFKKSEKDVIGGLCSLANIPLSPETAQDQERRIRREIANSNERRRMQSINAGFQSLKTLLPHTDGEKLSKAAILQQTSDYIFALEQEKTQLLQQNNQLKRFIQEFSGSSPKRRRGAEEKDEGIGSPDILEEEKAEELRREMLELRQQLDKERSARMILEEQVRSLDMVLHPERLKVITQQVQEEQAHIQTQTLLRLQQLHAETSAERDRHAAHSPQVQRHRLQVEDTDGSQVRHRRRARDTQSTDGETHKPFLNGRNVNVLFSFLLVLFLLIFHLLSLLISQTLLILTISLLLL
uniref:Transcription factor AP-4 n=1 Tax=Salmo trutta TaxID=8032 RepID=A0A674BKP1_SALTR